MKRISLCIFLLAALYGSINAQDLTASRQNLGELYQKHVKLDITSGANFDLARSSNNPAAALLGTRNTVAPLLDFRITHLFSRRIGWYAATRFKFFKSKNEYSSTLDEIIDYMTELFFTPLSTSLHIAYNAGMVYRLESPRWRCYPRIGLGASYYGSNKDRYKKKGNEIWMLNSNGNTFCMELGLSAHYMFNPKISLLLDISYQQPFNKAKADLVYSKNGETKTDAHFKSSTYGRELNVSTGIGFTF